MKKLGFVIVNYNDYKTTKDLINNIKEYKCIEKIVIVDNNSTDDSYDKLKLLENKKLTIIKNSDNSYASGLNMGAKYLIKEIGKCNIIFSNSDIIIKSEKDLIKLSSDTDKHHIGVVAPIIKQNNEVNRGWKLVSANKEILFNLPFIHRYFKKRYLNYKDSHYNEELAIVEVVSGCFFLVNSDLLKEINYFDSNTFLYYEENILACKVRDTNYQVAVDTEVEVIHNHSVTIDKAVNKIKKYKILKSSQSYYTKTYLNANVLQRLLLFITNKLSLIILYIRCFLRKEK